MAKFTLAKAQELASRLRGDVPSVLAVSEVESGGRGDLPDGRPVILFEAQWFHKFTKGKYDTTYRDISSPTWNKSLYVGGAAEYSRLARAANLDRAAAYQSISMGLFQIMGFHFQLLEFGSAEAMWQYVAGDDDHDMEVFARFMEAPSNAGLLDAFRRHDDRTFAELYNGTGQIEYYARKIAAARAHYAGGAAPGTPSAHVLRKGDQGDAVAQLQVALSISPADGKFGPATELAVKMFQQARGLVADGLAGPQTLASLGLS